MYIFLRSSVSTCSMYTPVVPFAHVAGVPDEEGTGSFWSGYQFKSQDMEDKYLKRFQKLMVRAFQLWGISRILFDVCLPFSYLHRNPTADFFMAYLPGNVVTVVSCLVITLLPRFRGNIVLVISIVAVLMAIAAGWVCHVHTREWTVIALDQDLTRVVRLIRTDKEAMQELEVFLKTTLGASIVNMQMALHIPQVLLLSFAGLWRSTIIASVLMPMGMMTVLLLSNEVSQFVALIRSIGGFVMAGFLLGNITTVTLGRRKSFSLEHSFQAALELAVEASRKADSILNHTLKNTMADAVGDIDMFLQKTAANIDIMHLRQAAAALRRGMRQCRHRQAYLQLAAHRYQVVLQTVDLKAFASELTSGRQVTLDVCELTVMLDVTLCSLILENALSNAFKHGCPQNPAVRLTITVASSNSAASSAAEDNKVCVKFTVINRANPTRPVITPDYVKKVLSGEARRGSGTSPMSDQIGLQHTFLAARAAGMTVSLTQTAGDVVFAGQSELQMATSSMAVVDEMREQDLAQFPNDLHICCIDDSDSARRLLHFNLTQWGGTKNVHIFGKDETEASEFVLKTVELGHIAILDQNLEYGGESSLLGTDLVELLVAKHFEGLICMRSGNVSARDMAKYRNAGAHCIFGKDVPMRKMIEDTKVAYVRHVSNRALHVGEVIRVSNSSPHPFSPMEAVS